MHSLPAIDTLHSLVSSVHLLMLKTMVPTVCSLFLSSPSAIHVVTGTVSLSDWPVDNDVAAEELERMKSTHCAIPLPAYDSDNHLIHPSAYRRELQGALVKIQFTLSHCAFKNKDAFSADIHTIRVLRAPHTVSSITKRRLPSSFERPSASSPTSFVQGKTASSSKKTRLH